MIRVGIDLGCDHIRLVSHEEGLVFDEPSMVAFDKKGHVLAIGNEARDMKELMNDDIRIVSPLLTNNIDFDALHALIDQLCYDYHVFRMLKKTILLFSYPTNLSNELCEELKKHLLEFGASRVYFDQEIWIAAIGAKLDLFLPVASCVMNIGSSNCDIALFASGTMQKKDECKISGIHVNMQIKNWLSLQYGLDVTEDMIEMIKCGIGQTIKQESPKTMIIQGINRANGQLCSLELNENQLVDVLYPLCQQWAHWIMSFIDSLSNEQKEDVYRKDAEIGYYLLPEEYSKGIMTEAVRQICETAFEKLDIIRITGLVYEPNIASRKVLEKNNFILEGTMKKAVIKNNNIYDLCIYGKIR